MTRHPARASTPYRTGLDGSFEAMRQSDTPPTHEGHMTRTDTRTAKDPQAWVDAANAASIRYGEGRTFRLVSIDGTTKSGRKQFTFSVTKENS
jgi:hypothetical protein